MSCSRFWGKVLKICKITSVGQSIKVDNAPAGPLVEDVTDKICPNKTGTTGD
jgi:hypothetical protein